MVARALRADPHFFRPLALEHPLVLQLRERTRTSNELVRQATRYGNQIRQQLWRYFPQLLQIPRLGNPGDPSLVPRAVGKGQDSPGSRQADPPNSP